MPATKKGTVIFKRERKARDSDDLMLIKQYLSTKDLYFLGVLYERYMHLVYGLCLKYLKDREKSRDAVMQVFEELVNKVQKHEIRNFKAWLYVLARNHCLMQLRREKAEQKQMAKYADEQDDFMESEFLLHPDSRVSVEEDIEALKKCIERLKEEQQKCIQLFYLDEYCYAEIVQLTGFPLKKVKSYIQNGKRNLKICLKEKNG